MRNENFWTYFNKIKPLLAHRGETFHMIFEYLDRFDHPIHIIETGCLRGEKDNWSGDGQGTILFDRYVSNHPGSSVETVDIDPVATACCRRRVSPNVLIHTGDSIAFLHSRSKVYDLVYLDSTDDPTHILKELFAISKHITPQTLVVIDDNFRTPYEGGGFLHGGKGAHVAHYLSAIGIERCFTDYQCGWIGL